MKGDAGPLWRSMLQHSRIVPTLRSIQDLDPNDTSILVIVENNPEVTHIIFLNWSPQYLAILLAR
jgi:hypothetical protein